MVLLRQASLSLTICILLRVVWTMNYILIYIVKISQMDTLQMQPLNLTHRNTFEPYPPEQWEGVDGLPVGVVIAPSMDIPPKEPKCFFVTLEMIWHPGNTWLKHCDINRKVVITNLTENDTVKSFRMKVWEEDNACTPDKMWRVFFPHNLLDYFVWRLNWDREDYLVDMTVGAKTLKDIGIGPDNNCLLYFIQTQFESRDEP